MTASNKVMNTWDVKRGIKLVNSLSREDVSDIRNLLEGLGGLISIQAEFGRSQIEVVYDASRLDYQVVVAVLEESGFLVARDWWNVVKARVYEFSDQNARDNAKAPPPACCNKPPK